jgi:integrase
MPERAKEFPKTDKGWQAYLQNTKPPEQREWHALGGGLTICLEPSGAKTFQARVRRRGDKAARRTRIGSFPAVSIAAARQKLAEMKSIVREGRDPSLEARRARAGINAPRTLRDLIEEYLTRRESDVAAKTLKIERDLLRGVLAPTLGARLLADLEPIDLGKAVADYAGRLRKEGRSNGTNANKLLAASRRMFKLARGWGLIGANDPTAGLVKPAKELPSDRVLFDGKVLVGEEPNLNELGRLVAALTAEPSPVPVNRATRLALMLTLRMGFRALEVCALEWRAIDLDGDTPSITVTRSKTAAGRRSLPLPRAAVETVRELKRDMKKGATLVFPAEEGSKRAAHLHPESLSRAFARVCERLGIPEASTHDLRRTCLSGLNELGHESVAERIAGHRPRHVMGRHYDQSKRLRAMREALEDWSAAIDRAGDRFRGSGERASGIAQ